MEKTLNIGSFEAMDSREMMEVDGGNPLVYLAVAAAEEIVYRATGKTVGGHVVDFIKGFVVVAY